LPLRTQKDIRTEGMFTALNDCNLRMVGRYELVVMVDVDEYILPREKPASLVDIHSLPDENALLSLVQK